MSTIGLPAEQSLILTKWAGRWIKYAFNVMVHGTPCEQVGKQLLRVIEDSTDEAADLVEVHEVTLEKTVTTTQGGTTTVIKNTKVAHKLKKGKRSAFSVALAKRAYVKFGARPVSEANVLVTRKWIHKLMEDEFKDLRTCDKAIAIDRATFLSFVPTMSWNNTKFVMENSTSVKNRVKGDSVFSRIARWANRETAE
jgi:hypothetical protein